MAAKKETKVEEVKAEPKAEAPAKVKEEPKVEAKPAPAKNDPHTKSQINQAKRLIEKSKEEIARLEAEIAELGK